jgi:hypothetical protein
VESEVLWCVVEKIVPTLLRLEQDGKGGIPADVYPLDRVHLAGDA